MRKEEEDNKGKKKKEVQWNTDGSAISLHDIVIATSTGFIIFHELPGLCVRSYEGTRNLSPYTNNTGAERRPAERQHIRARPPSAPPLPPESNIPFWKPCFMQWFGDFPCDLKTQSPVEIGWTCSASKDTVQLQLHKTYFAARLAAACCHHAVRRELLCGGRGLTFVERKLML